MATVTVTSKGQITIPAEIRKDLRLRAGDKLELTRNENTGRYDFRRKTGSIMDLGGILHRDGPPTTIEQMNQAVGDHLAEEDERIKREWREQH